MSALGLLPTRRVATLLILVALSLVLVAQGASADEATKRPTKVGYLLPLTGNAAAAGKNASRGFNLGLKLFSANNVLNGHKIELKYVDTASNPTLALNGVRDLVERQKVDVIEGPLTSPEIGPVHTYLAPRGIPTDDVQLCSTIQLDLYKRYDYAYASSWSCDQGALMAAVWAARVKGWKNVTIVARDLGFGWENGGAFATVFRKLGGKITNFIWIPLNATDYAPYMAQIPKNADAVFVEQATAPAIRFIKAYSDFGLKGKVPLLASVGVSDYSVLPAHDPNAILGVYSAVPYCEGSTSKLNKTFVKQYRAAYGELPSNASEVGFTKARILVNALKRLGGDASDHKKLIRAMKTSKIIAPRGPVRLDPKYLSPIQNIYICEVKRVNGELRNVPIKTYAGVRPWGPLSESEWLEHFKDDAAGRPS